MKLVYCYDAHEDRQVEFAADLQFALHVEGRDLTDDEAYRHLLLKYGIDVDDFYKKLLSAEYKEKAHYEFALVKQLKVTGFPCLLLQISESKFYLVARGYTNYEIVKETIDVILKEVASPQ
ncbi:MAG TPA: DsbA family protein [Chitinophagaceae bacterium]|nr:DsbA family protein [Chitinophagaceae bacterium]